MSSSQKKKSSTSSKKKQTKGKVVQFLEKAVSKASKAVGRKDLAGVGGKSWGHHVGNAVGGPIGAALGNAAHSLFKHLTGVGDYTLRGEAFDSYMAKRGHRAHSKEELTAQVPFFKTTKAANIVAYRDFVAPVLSSVAFQTTSYYVNPGLTVENGGCYDWLPGEAANYLRYKIHGQVFEYVPDCSVFSSSASEGRVYMSTLNNPTLLPLADEEHVATNHGTTRSTPAKPFYNMLECSKKESAVNVYDLRTTPISDLTTNQSLIDSDVGIFQISTVGAPSGYGGNRIGSLYVTYFVEFFDETKPVNPSLPAVIPFYHATSFTGASTGLGTVGTFPIAALNGSQVMDPATTLSMFPTSTYSGWGSGSAGGTASSTYNVDVSGLPIGTYCAAAALCLYTQANAGSPCISLATSTAGTFSGVFPFCQGLRPATIADAMILPTASSTAMTVNQLGQQQSQLVSGYAGTTNSTHPMDASLALYYFQILGAPDSPPTPGERVISFQYSGVASDGTLPFTFDFTISTCYLAPFTAPSRFREDPSQRALLASTSSSSLKIRNSDYSKRFVEKGLAAKDSRSLVRLSEASMNIDKGMSMEDFKFRYDPSCVLARPSGSSPPTLEISTSYSSVVPPLRRSTPIPTLMEVDSLADRLSGLEAALACYQTKLALLAPPASRVDSDFEEADAPVSPDVSTSIPVSNLVQEHPLTRSTIQQIGELVARKLSSK